MANIMTVLGNQMVDFSGWLEKEWVRRVKKIIESEINVRSAAGSFIGPTKS